MKENKTKIITVVIPARGRIDFVSQALESVRYQTGVKSSNIQTIVVEDDPDLKIRKALKDIYKEVTFVQNKDNEGPGGARNTGANLAKGKYLAFLDSDDVWQPEFVTSMIKVLTGKPNAVASLCFSKPFFDGQFDLREKIKLLFLCFIRDTILSIACMLNNRILYRSGFYLPQISHMLFVREKVKDISFDYQYRRGGEDWAYFTQCIKRGNIYMTNKRLLNFRYSKGSSTMQPINQKLKWDSYQRVIDNLDASFKRGILYWLFLKYMIFGRKNI